MLSRITLLLTSMRFFNFTFSISVSLTFTLNKFILIESLSLSVTKDGILGIYDLAPVLLINRSAILLTILYSCNLLRSSS